jgi:sugar lactone lactonase YvrE
VQDVARDLQGNWYITAPYANKVYKLTPAGAIFTFAGAGIAGRAGDGGPAAAALLNGPRSVVTDGGGNVYIADSGNNRVRKVDSSGTITTVAGSGIAGFSGEGGSALLANLSGPSGLGIGPSGELYILDSNNRIRKVDSNGIISTVAGSGALGFGGDGGPATGALLATGSAFFFTSASPSFLWRSGKLAVDAQGNLYVADAFNYRIREVLTDGTIRTIAGTGTAGFSGEGDIPTSANLLAPMAVAFDAAGNLLIADNDNSRIRKITASGTIITIAGNGTFAFNGDGQDATLLPLFLPLGLAADPFGGVVVADQFNNRVRSISPSGAIATIAGNSGIAGGDGGPASSALLFQPNGLAFDGNGNLFIADSRNGRIRRVDPSGTITTVAGTGSLLASAPDGGDDDEGDDSGSDGLVNGDGGPATSATLGFPYDVAPDGSGNLYIVANSRVRKIASNGVISTIAGTGVGLFGGDNGPAVSAQISNPQGIAVGPDGAVYVADTGNNRVRRVDLTSGVITTVAGTGVSGSAGDGGPATAAQLAVPRKLAFDPDGNLYVAVSGRVRKIAPNGVISTLSTFGGTAVAAGSGSIFVSSGSQIQQVFPDGTTAVIAGVGYGLSGDNGPALMASIGPGALAVNGGGEVFFADEADNLIRKVTPTPAGSPVLSVSPSGIDTRLGNIATASTLNIAAPATVNWTATASVTTPSGGTWLSVPATGGTGASSLGLITNPAGLAPGIYNGSVTISSAQAVNAVTIPVTMTVLPAVLSANTSAIAVAATAGGANPASSTIGVGNAGSGAPLAFTPAAAVITPAGGSWLSVSPVSETTGPVTASYNIAGLLPGIYSGTITLSSSQSFNPQLKIPVTLTVNRSGAGPTVASIIPTGGVRNQTVALTVAGSGFVPGATSLSVSGTGVTPGSINVFSATQLSTSLTIASDATTGVRTVSITTQGSPVGAVGFFTIGSTAVPSLSLMTPAGGGPGDFVSVTMNGNVFVPGATTVSVGGTGVTASAVRVTGNTTITAVFRVDPSAAAGVRSVIVSTPAGTSTPVNFTVMGRPVPTSWTPLGPAAEISGTQRWSGRVAGVAAHPADPNTLYMASSGGGVWKTIDGGQSWQPLTDDQMTLTMGAIAIAPSSPDVIYAATGEANNSGDSYYGRGILKSSDGGVTWTLLTANGAFDRRSFTRIVVDPADANTVYAAVASGANGLAGNRGIWKSTDGGANWINTTAAISTTVSFSDVQIDPNQPNIIYAAVYGGSTVGGVYKSTNRGTSWSQLKGVSGAAPASRISIAVAKSNSQVLYVSTANGTDGTLYSFMRSDDGGATFTNLTSGTPNYMGGQGTYDMPLIVDPSDSATVYAGGQAGANGVIKSSDSGVTWSGIGSTPHPDHHAFTFDANGKLIDGDDGGVWRLESVNPGGAVWKSLNAQINTIEFVGITTHPTDPSIVLGGSQDNGTSMFTGLPGWRLTDGGDGGFVKISRTNGSRVYHQIPVGSAGVNFFRRSDNGGLSWTTKTGNGTIPTANQAFYAPFILDPNNGDRVVYGGNQLWETMDGAETWTAISTVGSNGWNSTTIATVSAIALSASDVNTVYASINGAVYGTTTHGAQWQQCSGFGGGLVTNAADLQVDPLNSQTVYAAVANFNTVGNVFVSADGCGSWTNISGNLPGLPVYTIQLDPRSGAIYVGADDGVYVSADHGASWARFGAGLPHVRVRQLDLNTTLDILAAGTYGRGVWEISTAAPSTALTKLTLASQPATTPVGQVLAPVVVQITDGNGSLMQVSADITIALDSGANGAILHGTTTRPAVAGVATFNDLTVDRPGRGYSLLAFGAKLGGVVSNPFDVTFVATPTLSFSLVDRGGATWTSSGQSFAGATAGYGTIRPAAGSSTPSGLAIFGLRQNNVLVSEAGVPASPLILSGRIYAEIGGSVGAGLAMANPSSQSATVSFFYTDRNGDSGQGTLSIPANGQIARFLNDSPFNAPSTFAGSFTFRSSSPIAVIALRGLTNARGEFLMTTLPVIDLSQPPSQQSFLFSHFADGGGWSTQLVLVNPTDATLSGTVQFRDPTGKSVTVTAGGQTGSSFNFSLPPRASQKLQTAGIAAAVQTGSVLVTPGNGSAAPSGVLVFSLSNGATTVAEAGVPVVTAASAFRLYVESSGNFKNGATGSIQTGLAVANASHSPATVTVELNRLDGSSSGLTGSITLPADGQQAIYLDSIAGLGTLQPPFKGILRFSSTAPISVVGLRGRYNERGEFLFTTLPAVNESTPAGTAMMVFPHFVDSGGYTTQFILFSGTAGQASSGVLQLFNQSGAPLGIYFPQN